MTRKFLPYYPLFTLGILTISTQVILLRRLLDVFYGNELVIGIFFTNWMLLSGMGAWLVRVISKRIISPHATSAAFLILGIVPLLTAVGIVAGRMLFFPTGSTTGFTAIFLFTLLIEAPFCLLSGWLFPTLTAALKVTDDFTLSRAYLWESMGSFAGALGFSLLLFVLPSMVILYLLMSVAFFQSWVMGRHSGGRYFTLKRILTFIILILLLVLLSPQDRLTSWFYRGQQVIQQKESPYGNLVVTESEGQKNFYENGIPQFSSNDPISREEGVHFALLQHPVPRKVLLISGGISGSLAEILRYPVEEVYYLEVNPLVTLLGKQYKLIPSDPRIRVVQKDARLWLKTCGKDFDVILIQVPDPVTAQLNRYFTYEFFRELHQNLEPGAVISVSLRGTPDYLNTQSKNINSLIYNSLYYNYQHVLIVPGGRNYYLASNKPLSLKLDSLVTVRRIQTVYVNEDHLPYELLKQRSDFIQDQLDKNAKLNRDFHPRAYLEETHLWLIAFRTPWWIFGIICTLFTIFYLIRIKRAGLCLFVTGFSASSVSFMLLIAFQALYGYVYLMTGVLISLFMLGLVSGSLLHPILWQKGHAPSPAWNQIFLGAFVLLLLMFLLGNKNITASSQLLTGLFLLMSFLSGLFTGIQFSAVATESEDSPDATASRIYSADLIGSALGMLVTSAVLFPLAGLVWVCLSLVVINFLTGFLMFE